MSKSRIAIIRARLIGGIGSTHPLTMAAIMRGYKSAHVDEQGGLAVRPMINRDVERARPVKDG